MDIKKIAALAVAEDSAEESAVEVALEYLKNEPTPPLRCRYPKVPMLSERRGKSAATPAEDADPTPPLTDLQKHDRRFHPKGYKKGESCKYRERLDAGDDSDASLAAAEKEESGHLPLKKRDEYLRLMEKKHPELDAGKLLSELGKISDRKIQADAFAWVMRGAVKLPEDLYKVEQARELAGKAKVDPFSYNTPQACINDLLGKGHKVSLKPITVEELKKNPLMSDYQKLPCGVETFEVDDSREGQELMREVINTHWGKDANPWCLLHGDGEGNLSDGSDGGYDAWEYWQRYSALPKRVAFKDGKLLAFMATEKKLSEPDYEDLVEHWDERDEWFNITYDTEFDECPSLEEWAEATGVELQSNEEWWDRQDSSHDGIPLGNVPVKGDPYGRWADGEIRNGEIVYDREDGYHKGTPGEDGYVEWYESGNIKEKRENGQTHTYHEDGSPAFIPLCDMAMFVDEKGNPTEVFNHSGKSPAQILDDPDDERTFCLDVKLDGEGNIGNVQYNSLFPAGEDTFVQNHILLVVDPETKDHRVLLGWGLSGTDEIKSRAKSYILNLAQDLIRQARKRVTPEFLAAHRAPPPKPIKQVAKDMHPAFDSRRFADYLSRN